MYQEATEKLKESLQQFLREHGAPVANAQGWSWGGIEDDEDGMLLGDEERKLLVDRCRTELGGDVRLLGLHVKPAPGMRVRAAMPGLAHAGSSAGVVTILSTDGGACWVKWDHMEPECGWYKVGAQGIFSLKLVSAKQETPLLPNDVMRTGGNSTADIDARAGEYRSETRLAADHVLSEIGELLGM